MSYNGGEKTVIKVNVYYTSLAISISGDCWDLLFHAMRTHTHETQTHAEKAGPDISCCCPCDCCDNKPRGAYRKQILKPEQVSGCVSWDVQ